MEKKTYSYQNALHSLPSKTTPTQIQLFLRETTGIVNILYTSHHPRYILTHTGSYVCFYQQTFKTLPSILLKIAFCHGHPRVSYSLAALKKDGGLQFDTGRG